MHLVIFDLDHTLLKVNSSFHFGLFLYRQRYFSFWMLLLSLSDYLRHKWLGMSAQALHVRSFARLFQGRSFIQISHYVEQFLDHSLSSMLYDPIIQRLTLAQQMGNKVIILSNSPDFLVKAIARRLQVADWKATTYQINQESKFTHIANIMEGQDKAECLVAFASEMGRPLSATVVYSDSYLDLPLLRIAGQAIGVRPDYRLKQICLQNGWEIL